MVKDYFAQLDFIYAFLVFEITFHDLGLTLNFSEFYRVPSYTVKICLHCGNMFHLACGFVENAHFHLVGVSVRTVVSRLKTHAEKVDGLLEFYLDPRLAGVKLTPLVPRLLT